MDGTLPAGLLCAVAGMMLGFAPIRQIVIGTLLLALIAIAASRVAVQVVPEWVALGGCWVGLLACALGVYRPTLPSMAIGLAAQAGFWTGVVAATTVDPNRSLLAVPAVLSCIPAAWLVRKGYRIIPYVVTSWLLAVAMIAAVLPLVVAHPGYVPDHMQ